MEYTTFGVETRMHPKASDRAEHLADCIDAWIRQQTKTGKDNFTAERIYTVETCKDVWEVGYWVDAW